MTRKWVNVNWWEYMPKTIVQVLYNCQVTLKAAGHLWGGFEHPLHPSLSSSSEGRGQLKKLFYLELTCLYIILVGVRPERAFTSGKCSNISHEPSKQVSWKYSVSSKLQHPFSPAQRSPKISSVILLTVCHTALVMLVWRIWYWNNL